MSHIYIKTVLDKFGSLDLIDNLDKFLIDLKLRSVNIIVDIKDIKEAIDQGLKASMLKPEILSKLKKSPDVNIELLYVANNIDKFKVKKRLAKKNKTQDDMEIICRFLNLLNEIKSDSTRFDKVIKNLPNEFIKLILDFIKDIEKYNELESKLDNRLAT